MYAAIRKRSKQNGQIFPFQMTVVSTTVRLSLPLPRIPLISTPCLYPQVMFTPSFPVPAELFSGKSASWTSFMYDLSMCVRCRIQLPGLPIDSVIIRE
ncbi:hypothetical protein EYC84_005466 [Monilinia fructicola]|uniref:Uncharacterized protein n=1 Tax=Monilinia fructicola TaxID=38448 RepID=A0A5M9JXH2_MONFR|nr:hypothetical protein EYC84_005466 [Monilinia fructicola]